MSLLSVNHVGKAYRSYASEWARVAQWFGGQVSPAKEHWVLRHVNFELRHGESVGIIGRNGSGKSTLLKIIAKTLQPTEGSVQINGSVAAILELGMGFNRELTGRANVIHVAGLMGIQSEMFSQLVPEVMEFAELGDYFDQPVRTYSSGMSARLAFALATAHRPDLLIIDEALSVGDDAFRRKCFARIEDYLAQGTALLFVSHSVEQIRRVCSRTIYLNQHRVVADGAPKEVCALYEKDTYAGLIEHKGGLWAGGKMTSDQGGGIQLDKPLDLKGQITSVSLQNSAGEEINLIPAGLTVRIGIRALLHSVVENMAVSVGIKTPDGVRVYASVFKRVKVAEAAKELAAIVEMKAALLPGSYFISVGLFEASGETLELIHQLADEVMFRVYRNDQNLDRTEIGFAGLDAEFRLGE